MARDKREVRKSNVPQKNVNENKTGVLIYHDGMTVSEVATGLGKPLGEIIKISFDTQELASNENFEKKKTRGVQ